MKALLRELYFASLQYTVAYDDTVNALTVALTLTSLTWIYWELRNANWDTQAVKKQFISALIAIAAPSAAYAALWISAAA